MKRENIKLAKHRKKNQTRIYYFRRSHIFSQHQQKKKYKELKMRRIVNSIKTCEKISKSYKATNSKVIQKMCQ